MNNVLTIIVIGIVLILLFFSACKSYKIPEQITLTQGGVGYPDIDAFRGIKSYIKDLNTGEQLNVFLVHGMRTHGIDDYDEVVTNLSKYLSIKIGQAYTIDEIEGWGDTSPKLKIYYGSTHDNKHVQFTYVNWSPVTTPYKKRINAIDENDRRAKINRSLKDSIVNDGFGDVGAMAIQENYLRVFKALEIDDDDYNTSPDKTIIISASLGSKIVQEFVQNFAAITRDASFNNQPIACRINNSNVQISPAANHLLKSESLLTRTYQWYLFSNQLVLLDGIEYNYPGIVNTDYGALAASDYAPDYSQHNVAKCKDVIRSHSSMVSFFDPNDFLGFKIPSDLLGAIEPYNISIPIQRKSFFGIANPLKAHTGAKEEPFVLYLIANGWDGNIEKLPKEKILRRVLSKEVQKIDNS